MKKKIFGAMVVVAIVVGAMTNVNLNKVSNNGDLALANVEALASGESSGCPNGCMGPGSGCWCYTWYYTLHEGSL